MADHRRDEPNMEAEALDGEFMPRQPVCVPGQTPPGVDRPAPRGYSWRATTDVAPGMVTARPVVGTSGSRATMHLAIGSVISVDTLAQLVNKGVECVAVWDDRPPDAALYAQSVDRYQARLRQIFEAEPDETCRPLFDALVGYGPLEC